MERFRWIQNQELRGELEADRVFSDLMGKDPSARFQFIMDQAPQAEALELDV